MVSSMFGWRCQLRLVQCTGGGVRYGEFSVRVEVSGMVSSEYGWRCQVWYVQCMTGGVRYGEFSV